MKISKSSIPDVLIINPTHYKDSRGIFMESFRCDVLKKYGINEKFVQDNLVFSKMNVLRGLHYQFSNPQGKLIYVVQGKIFDVAVDIRKKSTTYGQWVGELLSSDNCKQLYIPQGFAHGYCVLSDTAKVVYKCTDFFYPDDQNGIIWNDTKIKIDWPINNPIISEKDSKLPTFEHR